MRIDQSLNFIKQQLLIMDIVNKLHLSRMTIRLLTSFLLLRIALAKLNFLLIIVDDLKPALGCYGDNISTTPHIDFLAKESVIFSRAYAQQALCAPSRNSFLTGRRPDTLGLYDFFSYWRDKAGNYTTLPQHLKNHGYTTMSIGKVFHPGISSNNSDDSPYSWSEEPFHPYTDRYKDAPLCRTTLNVAPMDNLVCPVHVKSMPNQTLPDIEILKKARKFLRSRRTDLKSFFLAVGFHKPHIPLKYPAKYLKDHPLRKFWLPQPYEWPKNVSTVAYNPWTDIRKRKDVEALHLHFPWEKIPENFAKWIIQSYYATVSYIDDLVGRLIRELDKSNMRQNTVVILTSDHGWSLGEHAEWAKYSNFDVAVRVPLIVSIPQVTFSRKKEEEIESPKVSVQIDTVVELVDIFPTIADLAGSSIPICSNRGNDKSEEITCAEGISLMPLITSAASYKKTISWKKGAFSQYPRPGIWPTSRPNSDKPRLKEITIMGYSLRTNDYRYTIWLPFSYKIKQANWKIIISEELYDHKVDPGENVNLANFPNFLKIKEELKGLIKRGWREALPK